MLLIPIEMPSSCLDCPCHNGEFGFCQALPYEECRDWEYNDKHDAEDKGPYTWYNRRDNCPLREVTPPLNDVLELYINEQQETIDKQFADLKKRYEKMQEVKHGFKGGSVPLCFGN